MRERARARARARARWVGETAIAVVLAACSTGAPPGFSAGETWTAPLVGPLEDSLLFVPVMIGDHGPYLFAIDPDANVSIVDDAIVAAAGLRTGEGPHMLDEEDREQPRIYAEVLELQVGSLAIHRTSNASAVVVKTGGYDRDGRHIHGVLGRDVIADSLVFGFDRDHGVAMWMTQGAFAKSHGKDAATAIHLEALSSSIENVEVAPVPRRLVKARIGGKPFTLHFDLGAVESQLRARAWPAAGIASEPVTSYTLDETGTAHAVDHRGYAARVEVAGVGTDHVLVYPYADKRWPAQDLDGTYALDALAPYAVMVDWDHAVAYVKQRGLLAQGAIGRIGRWSPAQLGGCAKPVCVDVKVTDPLDGVPADQVPSVHPGLVASFARPETATAAAIEALVAVTPPVGGKPLPWLVVAFPERASRVISHLSADYVGATYAVVDVDPFPRACPSDDGCVDKLAPPPYGGLFTQPPPFPPRAP